MTLRPSDILFSLSPAARTLFDELAYGPVMVFKLTGAPLELMGLRLIDRMVTDQGYRLTVSDHGAPVAEWIREVRLG